MQGKKEDCLVCKNHEFYHQHDFKGEHEYYTHLMEESCTHFLSGNCERHFSTESIEKQVLKRALPDMCYFLSTFEVLLERVYSTKQEEYECEVASMRGLIEVILGLFTDAEIGCNTDKFRKEYNFPRKFYKLRG